MTKTVTKTRVRTLDNYRRHVQLYGPECVLQTAAEELAPDELVALERFIAREARRKGSRKAPTDTAEALARRIASARRDCEVLNIRVTRAHEARDWGRAEALVSERDALRRGQEDLFERLKIRRVIDGAASDMESPIKALPTPMNTGDARPDPAPGDRFGRLTVAAVERNAQGRKVVGVRCDCGVRKAVRLADLLGGKTKSCGCLAREMREAMRKAA